MVEEDKNSKLGPLSDFQELDSFLDRTPSGEFLLGQPPADTSKTPDAEPGKITSVDESARNPSGAELLTRLTAVVTGKDGYRNSKELGLFKKNEDDSRVELKLLLQPQKTKDGLIRAYIRQSDWSGIIELSTTLFSIYADGRVSRATFTTDKHDASKQTQSEGWLDPAGRSELYSGLLAYL